MKVDLPLLGFSLIAIIREDVILDFGQRDEAWPHLR